MYSKIAEFTIGLVPLEINTQNEELTAAKISFVYFYVTYATYAKIEYVRIRTYYSKNRIRTLRILELCN